MCLCKGNKLSMCICMYIQCVSSEKECVRVCAKAKQKKTIVVCECSGGAVSTGDSMSVVYKMVIGDEKASLGFSKGVYGTTT